MRSRFFTPSLVILAYLALAATAHALTPLEASMKRMSSAYRALTFDLQQPSDAHKDTYLSLAGILKTEAQTSRGLVPKKAGALPADQQAAMVKGYQKGIDDLIQSIDSLTQAIQGSQWGNARQTMAAIKQKMMAGHKDFRAED